MLVSGMGGELGSLVAAQLEAEPWVGSLVGIDVDPPRRRLRKAEFHLLQPSQRERIVDVVTMLHPPATMRPTLPAGAFGSFPSTGPVPSIDTTITTPAPSTARAWLGRMSYWKCE